MKKTMVAFQVRLSDGQYEQLKASARAREISNIDIIREAVERYCASSNLAETGFRLYAENPVTGDRVELIIPAFSSIQRGTH